MRAASSTCLYTLGGGLRFPEQSGVILRFLVHITYNRKASAPLNQDHIRHGQQHT